MFCFVVEFMIWFAGEFQNKSTGCCIWLFRSFCDALQLILQEDYLNESTLDSRLGRLIKGRQLKNSNQGHTNSSMVGTMAPTSTGLSHAGGNPSSMVTSSACASVGLGPSPNTSGPMDHDVLELRQYMRTLV